MRAGERVVESASKPKSKKAFVVITAIVAAAVVLISAISLAVLWPLSASTPNLEVEVNHINFYNETLLPALDGYVLIQFNIDVSSSERKAVPLDPCDFILETSDGHMQHFAWRIGNYTGITVYGEESNTSNQGRDLPSGGVAWLWIPFEIPTNLTLRSIIWESTLGEVSSFISDYVNEELLSFEAGTRA